MIVYCTPYPNFIYIHLLARNFKLIDYYLNNDLCDDKLRLINGFNEKKDYYCLESF